MDGSELEKSKRRASNVIAGYLLLAICSAGGTLLFLKMTQNCTSESSSFTDSSNREVTVSAQTCRQMWESP